MQEGIIDLFRLIDFMNQWNQFLLHMFKEGVIAFHIPSFLIVIQQDVIGMAVIIAVSQKFLLHFHEFFQIRIIAFPVGGLLVFEPCALGLLKSIMISQINIFRHIAHASESLLS